jgi:DNA-binding NtrC family response regulator
MNESGEEEQLASAQTAGAGPRWHRRVLAITPDWQDQILLHDILKDHRWSLQRANTCREALKVLCVDRPPLLICEHRLADGTWMDILSQTVVLPDPPHVIVASMSADDRLRTQVIDMGGYEVLSKPWDRDQVVCVVSAAWRNWATAARCRFYRTRVA